MLQKHPVIRKYAVRSLLIIPMFKKMKKNVPRKGIFQATRDWKIISRNAVDINTPGTVRPEYFSPHNLLSSDLQPPYP